MGDKISFFLPALLQKVNSMAKMIQNMTPISETEEQEAFHFEAQILGSVKKSFYFTLPYQSQTRVESP